MDQSDIRVLVVDDEDGVRKSLAAYLEDECFNVMESESGEDALVLVEKHPFDAGIIDMRLPGIDGNALILKAHEIQPNMKFLIHTGSTNYILPQDLIDIGVRAEHILMKPIPDMQTIVDSINRLFIDET